MAKEQLCWTCQKAGGDCSWSSCFQPVEGWTAERVHRKTYDSYRITKCPEYVPDKASNSENKKKTRVTNKELDTMKRLRGDGLSYFEIAKIVDRNPDVVRVNLVRC